MEPLYLDWDLEDRRKAVSFLPLFESPAFKPCEWVTPEPREVDGTVVHSLGWPEYDPRVYEFLGLAWNTAGIDPYEGEPWEPFWVKHCVDPGSFAEASVGDIRRYLLLLKRRERFGDGSIEAGFKNGTIVSSLRRLKELTPL